MILNKALTCTNTNRSGRTEASKDDIMTDIYLISLPLSVN